MLTRMSVKWRVAIGFLSVLVATLIAAGIAGKQLHKSYVTNLMVAKELAPKVAAASSVDQAFSVQNSNLRGYLVLGKERLRERYLLAAIQGNESLKQLQSFPQNKAEQRIIKSLTADIQSFEKRADGILTLADSGDRVEALRQQQLYMESLAADISISTRDYAQISQKSMDSHLAVLDQNVRMTYIKMVLAGVAAMLVALVAVLLTVFAVSEPVRKLMAAAESVQKDDYEAADRLENWRVRIVGKRGTGKNEMLRLATAFSSMVFQLRRRQNWLAAYGEVSSLCASAIELPKLLDNVVAKLAERTDSQIGVAHVISEDRSRLVPVGCYATGKGCATREYLLGEGIPGEAAKKCRKMMVNDIPTDGTFIIQTGTGQLTPRAIISIPLISENEVQGVVSLASVNEYSEDTVNFLEKSAGALAAAVHNALTHAQVNRMAEELSDKNELLESHNQELQAQNEEIQAQTAELEELNAELNEQREQLEQTLDVAEDRAHEISVLSDVGRTITESLDIDDILSTIEDQVRQLLDADSSSILVYSEDRQELLYTSNNRQLKRRHAVPEHTDLCETISAEVASTGKARIAADVPNCEHCKYSAMACADSGTHHLLSVPMYHKGEPIGAINAFRQNKPVFVESDIMVLSALANYVAVALVNARAYEEEHKIAEKLQTSFMPGQDFHAPGFTFGYHYTPATEQAKVGGDFYDVIMLDEDRAAVIMGDVSGKGINAAIYTSTVRHMLCGLILSGLSLSEAVSKLNDAVCEYTPPEIFVTMFVGILNTKHREMEYVNAGHDEPIFYSCSKKFCMPCDVTGRALGMLPDADYASRKVTFEDGDLVVLYTDGITEARKNNEFLGREGLEQIVISLVTEQASEIVTRVFAQVTEFAGRKLKDDAAVLIVKAIER